MILIIWTLCFQWKKTQTNPVMKHPDQQNQIWIFSRSPATFCGLNMADMLQCLNCMGFKTFSRSLLVAHRPSRKLSAESTSSLPSVVSTLCCFLARLNSLTIMFSWGQSIGALLIHPAKRHLLMIIECAYA